MAICYDKLWKLLIDKKMNRTELKEASGISFNVLARLGKNEPVSFESIEKICFTLNCKIENVVEIQKEEPIQIDSDAFTTIELFAGAGGLALGIEKAGFEPLGLIEFDKDAAESLKTNRPNWRVIHDDIANISCLDLEDYFGIKKGELDLLSGGAPCQAFSYAGKRLGLEDARGTLFYHYATFLQKLQPKMFLFENVRGLLTHDKGRTYATITNIFEQAGYTIQKKVLNAWDFGVPQIRKRLVLHGIRNDVYDNLGLDKEKQKILPKPTHSKEKKKGYRKWVTVRKAIFDLPILGAGESYDDNIIKNHKARSLSETNIERLQEIRLHGGNREMISEELQLECHKKENVSYTDTYGIIDPDKPAPTITSGCTIISKGRYCHPTQNRGLSIREAARLQSFDDKFEFQGNMGEMSLQIGNAVPPKLAQASGKVIINYMGLYENYLEAQTKGVITP